MSIAITYKEKEEKMEEKEEKKITWRKINKFIPSRYRSVCLRFKIDMRKDGEIYIEQRKQQQK